MTKTEFFAGVSALCLIAGCSSAAEVDPAAAKTKAPEPPGSDTRPIHSAPVPGGVLIDGTVSANFAASALGECSPFGLPITFFLTSVFGPETLVSETAKPVSDGRCVLEQVLEAPVDAWASLAYTPICQGGDNPSLCGAQAARLCSVNLILKWAQERTEAVSINDPTFGFAYVLAPQDAAARGALYARASREVDNLLADSAAIIADYAGGTRNCPNENYDEILATEAHAEELRQEISAHLNGA